MPTQSRGVHCPSLKMGKADGCLTVLLMSNSSYIRTKLATERTIQAINHSQDLNGLLCIVNEIFLFNAINAYKFQCIQILSIREEKGDD